MTTQRHRTACRESDEKLGRQCETAGPSGEGPAGKPLAADRSAATPLSPERPAESPLPRHEARARRTAAVVLAAGRSSRMGAIKALLPLHGSTALERVVSSLDRAGTNQVVVVTGHQADAVRAVVGDLRVDHAHNPGYDAGMFSSVQAGVAALRQDVEAFFVLPVDCPLVSLRTLRSLLDAWESTGQGIVYPLCCGRRGHPPLLSARYVRPLLEADVGHNLQEFLGAFPEDETEVDVRDLTVLMDMDTPEEYRALAHFAAALDGSEGLIAAVSDRTPGDLTAGTAGTEPSLTETDAFYLLSVAGAPGNVVEHCRAVAAVGRALALAVAPHVNELDASLVEIGCLLHDLTRLQPHHARLAEELLTNLGLPHLGEIVGQHMVIRPQEPRRPEPTEAELVYLADKLVADDAIVGLAERQARALRNVGPEATAAQRIRDRVADARLIAQKVTAVTGRPLEDILSEAMMQSGQEAMRQNGARRRGAQGDLEVFLVRHPESAGQNRKRFLGRADPDLGADGERQAEQLAGTLMEITGGVCFDAIYTSDLRRCLRTAQIVARGCRTPVQAVPWLREIDVGLWEGLSRDEAKRDFPQEHRRREHDLTGEPFPGGESFKDLQDRVMPPLLRLLDDALEAGRRRVLIVGHKGVNRVILARVLRLPLEALFSIEQDYSGIAIVRVDKDPGDGLRFSLVRRS